MCNVDLHKEERMFNATVTPCMHAHALSLPVISAFGAFSIFLSLFRILHPLWWLVRLSRPFPQCYAWLLGGSYFKAQWGMSRMCFEPNRCLLIRYHCIHSGMFRDYSDKKQLSEILCHPSKVIFSTFNSHHMLCRAPPRWNVETP